MSTPYIAFVSDWVYNGRMIDGSRVRYWRLARALTIRELAEKSGVNHSAISLIERGKRRPHPSTLRRLAEALDVEPVAFLRRDDDGSA